MAAIWCWWRKREQESRGHIFKLAVVSKLFWMKGDFLCWELRALAFKIRHGWGQKHWGFDTRVNLHLWQTMSQMQVTDHACEVVVASTWRQAGPLPLLAILDCAVQRRTLRHQRATGAAEQEGVVVAGWIKGQRVESWKTRTRQRATLQYMKRWLQTKRGNTETWTGGSDMRVLVLPWFPSSNPVGFIQTGSTEDLIKNTSKSMVLDSCTGITKRSMVRVQVNQIQ